MKLLRFILVLAVLAYAGWLAWPIAAPFFQGAPDAAAMRAGADAGLGSGVPTAAFWIGAAALYLISALLLGSGNPKAAVAYFLGFLADAALRLALDRSGGGGGGAQTSDITARSADAVAPAASALAVDPTWLVLGALLIVGVLIVIVSRRRRRTRIPGQLAT